MMRMIALGRRSARSATAATNLSVIRTFTALGRRSVRSGTTTTAISTTSPLHLLHRRTFAASSKIADESKPSAWSRTAANLQSSHTSAVNDGIAQTEYMKLVQTKADPTMHIKTIEDELMDAVAGALKKTADKVQTSITAVQETLDEMESRGMRNDADLIAQYKHRVVQAERMRLELIIHRQACGFQINNHAHVNKLFIIPKLTSIKSEGSVNLYDENERRKKEEEEIEAAVPKKELKTSRYFNFI
jgi:hypothetical protein